MDEGWKIVLIVAVVLLLVWILHFAYKEFPALRRYLRIKRM